jgi:predicted amidohydrolase
MVKVALGQFESAESVAANVRKIEGQIREAAGNGATLVAFHELATTPYFCFQQRNADWFTTAEPIPGPSSDRITKVVEETGCSVMFPSYDKDPAIAGAPGQFVKFDKHAARMWQMQARAASEASAGGEGSEGSMGRVPAEPPPAAFDDLDALVDQLDEVMKRRR